MGGLSARKFVEVYLSCLVVFRGFGIAGLPPSPVFTSCDMHVCRSAARRSRVLAAYASLLPEICSTGSQ